MYDYRCERCSVQFEVRQSFSDDSLSVCPPEGGPVSCEAPGEGPVKKVFSGVAIAFKGDGFYKNDHGANAKGRRKERESDSSKESSGSSTSKESSSKDSTSKESSSKDSTSSSSSNGGRAKADASTSSSSS
ncbi:MAG: zinc ribbon domain-containing protein [Acidimicrobiaceae bacterium]|nr:zinc ribbon domain-containing protein [Acidimicrobiaceae bacterium]MDE0667274.1 zinc ribbon domain-containing protein [Acidimicrobiaceae bacterium]MXY12161.1 zinc ribbon domain-containing protein [Acidimicrobiaceae bacterium]MXZ66581.1 zinc ribbon domain-containing protein [Acidimicrobiaceae bacterium]MYE66150.1 zinc ribbon domain-containing protein [Acidimicrobiaceae bacterium]